MDEGFVRMFNSFSVRFRNSDTERIKHADLFLINENYFLAFRGMRQEYNFEETAKIIEK